MIQIALGLFGGYLLITWYEAWREHRVTRRAERAWRRAQRAAAREAARQAPTLAGPPLPAVRYAWPPLGAWLSIGAFCGLLWLVSYLHG